MNHPELEAAKKARTNTVRERVHKHLLGSSGHQSIGMIRKALELPGRLEVEEAAVWLVKKDLAEAVELSGIIFYKADMTKAGPMTQTTKETTGAIEAQVGKPETNIMNLSMGFTKTKAVSRKRGDLVRVIEEALDWDLARSRDDIYKMVESQEISLKQVQHSLHALNLQGRAGAKMMGNVRHYRRTVPINHWAKKERRPRMVNVVVDDLPLLNTDAPIEERLQWAINKVTEARRRLAEIVAEAAKG